MVCGMSLDEELTFELFHQQIDQLHVEIEEHEAMGHYEELTACVASLEAIESNASVIKYVTGRGDGRNFSKVLGGKRQCTKYESRLLPTHTSPVSHQHRSTRVTMFVRQELELACTHTNLHTCTHGDKHTNIQSHTLGEGHKHPHTHTPIHTSTHTCTCIDIQPHSFIHSCVQ